MTAVEHGGGQVLYQCEIKNGASLQALEGTYKAIFANAEGRFKTKFGSEFLAIKQMNIVHYNIILCRN
jgi:hypothetical protein